MDISIAQSLLNTKIRQKTDELDVLKLASDILNEKYSAEFISLQTAQKEANDSVIALNAKKAELDIANTNIAQKDATITDLTSQVSTLSEKPVEITPIDEKPIEKPVDIKP
jgi:hypothetical protein